MSNCISLISCDGTCSNIHNIKGTSRTNLLPYIDDLVQINNNLDCTYFVRNTVLVGFRIDSTSFLCDTTLPDSLNSYIGVSYKVNSINYNGVQFINTPNKPTYTISVGGFDCLTCNDSSALCRDAGTIFTPNNTNAHTTPLNNILSGVGLNIQSFPYGDDGSFGFRLFDGDYFTIEIERTTAPDVGVYNLVYNNGNLGVTFNGTQVTDYLVDDDTNTCTNNKPSYSVTSVSAVTGCGVVNTYTDYVGVNECDVITIFPMGATCSIVNTLGKTGSTRSATLVVTGGTPPYSFQWENGNTTPTIINLPAGTYNATITDAFGDYIIETSCFLPPIDCSQVTIKPNMTYNCQLNSSAILTGFAFLSIIPTGGFAPYTFSGSVNGVVTGITNGMLLSHGDFVTVEVFDSNGCVSSPITIGVVCPAGPPLPPPPSNPINGCLPSISCPNSNTFLFEISATTFDMNNDVSNPGYLYEFNFKLSSPSNYSSSIIGSYKIFDIDLPNSFLGSINTPQQCIKSNPKYWALANATPNVSLNDYVEFGFTELTPQTPTNFDSPWNVTYWPLEENNYCNNYTPTFSWTPGVTAIQIDVALFDDEFCVHKGSTIINIPLHEYTPSAPPIINTASISF